MKADVSPVATVAILSAINPVELSINPLTQLLIKAMGKGIFVSEQVTHYWESVAGLGRGTNKPMVAAVIPRVSHHT